MAAQEVRMTPAPLTNWSGNIEFATTRRVAPTSIDELREVVAREPRIRAVGTAHSFNHIADTDATQISVVELPSSVVVSDDGTSATVSAGMRYGDVASRLLEHGVALHNLGSLPHISIAGSCATGTHGSGVRNRGLAGAVRAIELVTASGELVTLTRDADSDFHGAVVALGCLGVVTTMTLDVQPAFQMRQFVYDAMPAASVVNHFDEIVEAAYSVSLFTTWRRRDVDQVWVKQRMSDVDSDPDPRWFGAALADSPRHPLAGMPVQNCTPQLGLPGPSHERLPHFRLEFTPSAGEELQSEYLLPRERAVEAFDALAPIADQIAPVLQVSEIRTIAADDFWLSPSSGRDSVAFHFTWVKDDAAVRPVMAAVEARLAPFDPRPHWGKLFSVEPAAVRERYPKLADFRQLAERYDPERKFRNAFVEPFLR
ncbi:MAG TPA: D-arabinono-1,4-lactone oxidase [Acidothermaceae bacterium]|nr:D-arabinono-1,4-lactone oxidase [Acidothermaceae bacterium]